MIKRLISQLTGLTFAVILVATAAGCGGDSGGGGGTSSFAAPVGPPPPPPGSCQPSSSLSVLVTGKHVVSYVPKGNWEGGSTGVSLVNVEGSSITAGLIPTAKVVNSCASNPVSKPPMTVCTANNTDVYLIPAGSSPTVTTMNTAGSATIEFTGGDCTNCGVAMDAVHNKALIGLSLAGVGGFQYLDLGASPPAFEPAFASQSSTVGGFANISEDPLIDPTHNLLLSATENNQYEIVDVSTTTSPSFFENDLTSVIGDVGFLDSSGEDCTTGIALAPAEFSGPSQLIVADLTQATKTAGTPGTWSAPSQFQALTESFLEAGSSGIAVAQGTHTGIVTGEFGGGDLTAIALPSTSGSGTPAITDWVSCNIKGFDNGDDPHTVTAYRSPNSGHAIALLANRGATQLAVVDLTKMLDTTIVPRTSGTGLGHACMTGPLPASVVSFVAVP